MRALVSRLLAAPTAWGACVALGLAGLAGAPAGAQGQLPADEFVLEDAIVVDQIGRELVAFDLVGSGRLATRLEPKEEVLWMGSRGRVAVALTTARMLAVTPHSGSWQEERYRLVEAPVAEAYLSQTLALVVTPLRALAFFGTGNWTEEVLGPHEDVMAVSVGPAAGVVVTERRALGVSGETGGFFETKLRIHEEVESVRAFSGVATITTSQRTLLFKGPDKLWLEYDRPLR